MIQLPFSTALQHAQTFVRGVRIQLVALFVLLCAPLHAETPGKDGDATISGTQVVNEYAPLNGSAAAGSTTLDVVSRATNMPSLSAGDVVMLYQAQGATIDGSDSANYGNVTNIGSAGRYEFHTVRSVSGNTIELHTFGGACAGLQYSYDADGRPQVIRVPQYRNLNVNGSIVARDWDGTTGGIIAMTVSGTLTLSGSIDASGAGFRGGQLDNSTTPTGSSYFGYRSNQARNGAEKGEGIAGYRTDLPGGLFYGRGAPANGGGGGNGHNAGGGGGANGNNGNTWAGQGVPNNSDPTWAQAWNLDPSLNANTSNSGGGRGGYTYSRRASGGRNALTAAPGSNFWPNDRRRELGGLGGRPMDYDPTGRLFLGGGGGAGDMNNSAGGAGGRGGGLIFIQANAVTGGGTIRSNGDDGEDTSPRHNDGPGGGGAGGTIVVQSGGNIGAQLIADGGEGGTQFITNDENEGPGGGGGGGVIATTGGVSATFARGGVNGTTFASTIVNEFPPNGATMGATGQPNANAPSLAATPFCRAPDAPVQISKISRATATSGEDQLRIPGSDQTYTISFANPGAAIDANSIVITDNLPADIELWTGDYSGTVPSPVAFADGSGVAATGLTCCNSSQISYSTSETGNDFSYVPNGSYDPAVRRVRVNPGGAVAEGYADAKTFEIFLRARIK